VDGTMEVYNATVNAPLTISAGGEVLSTRQSSSYPARFDAPVTIDNGGKLSMNLYRTVVSGNGVITNHGLIQGASNNASYPTYLYNTVANASDGVVRAAANGGVTTAWFQLYGNMTNEGVMEADGGNLRFMSGSTVSNSGTLRALNGNEIRFQDGATVTDAGGGMLSLSGGGTGTITGSGTVVASGVSVAAGSTLYVQSSSQLHVSAGGMTNDGTVEVSGGSTFIADGPVVSGAGSTLSYASGSLLDFNGSLTVDGVLDMANNMLPIDGDLSFGANGALRAASGGSILLSGNFSNASTLNGDFDSLDLSLNLTANGNELDPLLFEIGGEDIDALMAGLTDNFAVGELLILGVDEFVQLMDVFDNALDGASNDALYVGALTITDLDSRLILNGVNVYYGTFTAPGGLSQIDMSGGGSFTALPGLLAPEPTTAWLLMLGGAWILGGRRRRSH
ncbi:MAG: PEP-CTERM sorting domain-containing protein, partial [Phycisphaerae bacterium]|nr:PEP-CTERM sorting domain-containing protein [Phycisphaerae bacterium]